MKIRAEFLRGLGLGGRGHEGIGQILSVMALGSPSYGEDTAALGSIRRLLMSLHFPMNPIFTAL